MDWRVAMDFVTFHFLFWSFGCDLYVHTFKINVKYYALAVLDDWSISKLVCLVERLGKQFLNKVFKEKEVSSLLADRILLNQAASVISSHINYKKRHTQVKQAES